jgi:predicted nucleic acid-binding protein
VKEKREEKFKYLLDTSAIIAYLVNEKGADKVKSIRETSVIPFIALSELYYLIFRKKGKSEADKIYGLVKGWKLPILFPDERIIISAGRIKAKYNLGLADSYIAAFAYNEKIYLVTKDIDYKILKDEIKIMML